MKVVHSRSESAISYTVRAPIIFVDSDGMIHEIEEWTIDAIRRPETLGNFPTEGELRLNFQGFEVGFPIELIRGPDPAFLYFTGLDARQNEILKLFYSGMISGRMAAADGVIQSIDVPVDKVPMSQTEEDRAGEREAPSRLLRAAVSMTLYLLAGLLVFGTLGYTIWYRTNFVEMSGARIVQTQDDAVAAQGWLPDDSVVETWVGMPAVVRVNIGGERYKLAGTVAALNAGPVSGDGAGGYLALVRFDQAGTNAAGTGADGATVGSLLTPGTPVDAILDREILPGVRKLVSGRR